MCTPSCRRRTAGWALLLLGLSLALPGMGRAATTLCVSFEAPPAQLEAFRKLALSEVDRHSSHQRVEQGCITHLKVEYFEVGGARYVTARAGRGIPIRYRVVDPSDLDHRLSQAISDALRSDPEHLARDISRLSAMQRAKHSVLVRGHNRFRFEVLQTATRGVGRLELSPGLGFSVTRGADHWQVFSRVYVGGTPGDPGSRAPELELHGGVDGGFVYELSRLANTSPYVGFGAGLQLLRFEGYSAADSTHIESVRKLGLALSARVGVRFMRLYDFDCDLFLAGYLPAFTTRHVDSELLGEDGLWTPSAVLGLGVGF